MYTGLASQGHNIHTDLVFDTLKVKASGDRSEIEKRAQEKLINLGTYSDGSVCPEKQYYNNSTFTVYSKHYTHVHTYMYTHTCTHVHTYICTHIHMYTHTYMYVHTYMIHSIHTV